MARSLRLSAASNILTSSCFWTLAVLTLLTGRAVHAQSSTQDESLLFQDLSRVTGASRYDQDTREAQSSISIITADEIRRYGYRTVAEALAHVRGFVVNDDRNYSYVGVRGFAVPGDYNSRILLLMDGHRINESVFGSAPIGSDGLIDMRVVERIEVVRGPGSSLYGTSAMFAVVNIVTRQPRWVRGLEVTASDASYGTHRGTITAGGRLAGGVELMVSAAAFRSDGQNLAFPGLGTAVAADGERYDRQFAKLTAGDWTLQAGRSWRLKQIPTGSFQTTFNDPRARTTDAYSSAFLRYRHGFSSLSSVDATFSYDAYTYHGRYPYATGLTTDYGLARSWSMEAQYVRLVRGSHRVVLGTAAQFNTKQDQGGDNVDSGTVIFRSHRASTVGALFAQDEWRLNSALQTTVGLRYDHYDTFGGTLNPRLAVVYDVPRAGTFKLLYGRAFRAPNVYEMDYQDGGRSSKASTGLQPERMESYEAVFEGRPVNRLRFTATAFVLNLSALITQVLDPTDSLLVYRNLGRARSQGVELEADVRLPGGFEAGASVTVQQVTDPTTHAALPSSPHALATAHFSAPVAGDRLRASLSMRYVGNQRSVMGTPVRGSAISDLTFVARVSDRFSADLGLYNVFNASYSNPAGSDQVAAVIPQNRRNLRAGLQVAF